MRKKSWNFWQPKRILSQWMHGYPRTRAKADENLTEGFCWFFYFVLAQCTVDDNTTLQVDGRCQTFATLFAVRNANSFFVCDTSAAFRKTKINVMRNRNCMTFYALFSCSWSLFTFLTIDVLSESSLRIPILSWTFCTNLRSFLSFLSGSAGPTSLETQPFF